MPAPFRAGIARLSPLCALRDRAFQSFRVLAAPTPAICRTSFS